MKSVKALSANGQKMKKHSSFAKFMVLVAVLVGYLLFAVHQFGLSNGILVAVLSWSFFVFCTPIADAGFMLDFPIRLITGLRMLVIEVGVWVFAAALNVFALIFFPEVYQKTVLLELFHKIITTPCPLFLIILLSGFGTFSSLVVGDDAFDLAVAKNKKEVAKKEKQQLLRSAIVFGGTLVLYIILLRVTHLEIKLFLA